VVTVRESVDKFFANLEKNQMTKRLNALESQIAELKSLTFQSTSYTDSESKKGGPKSGFDPESEPRQGLFRQYS